jgi:hypothetical protein
MHVSVWRVSVHPCVCVCVCMYVRVCVHASVGMHVYCRNMHIHGVDSCPSSVCAMGCVHTTMAYHVLQPFPQAGSSPHPSAIPSLAPPTPKLTVTPAPTLYSGHRPPPPPVLPLVPGLLTSGPPSKSVAALFLPKRASLSTNMESHRGQGHRDGEEAGVLHMLLVADLDNGRGECDHDEHVLVVVEALLTNITEVQQNKV